MRWGHCWLGCFAGSCIYFFFTQCFAGAISGQENQGKRCLRSDREISLLIPDGFRHDGVEGKERKRKEGEGRGRSWSFEDQKRGEN